MGIVEEIAHYRDSFFILIFWVRSKNYGNGVFFVYLVMFDVYVFFYVCVCVCVCVCVLYYFCVCVCVCICVSREIANIYFLVGIFSPFFPLFSFSMAVDFYYYFFLRYISFNIFFWSFWRWVFTVVVMDKRLSLSLSLSLL